MLSEIPVSFGNLNQLRDLSLADNQFSGNIPFSFANFTQLPHLATSNNHFTGEFPLALVNLTTSLSELAISVEFFLQIYLSMVHTWCQLTSAATRNNISAVIAYVPGVFCGLVIGHTFTPRIHKWFILANNKQSQSLRT
ncbi:hypothetical protein HID58_029447 [Brassica napus]|uniref:Uncharacterized protein n=1 Tax=Brassica napus TaxID=3708 RepID=A0ABQ8CD40_BRANA|nr:hypothetical protein HID58_029447 [Brassica napus]